ncbi:MULTISPECIES: hypothetical protein [unclassified Clostridium]|uniref:hypothetical protein n=1 Tax=unclassified Clostridium TaxID=2614128 RepID=UPI0025C2028D|nr:MULTISPECIES: hypothetical protein [unclassified Clostridium]
MENKNFVKVPNKFIKGKNQLSDEELLIYTFIKRNYLVEDCYVFNIIELTRLLNHLDKPKYHIKKIKQALKSLEEKKIFTYYSNKQLKNLIHTNEIDNNYLVYAQEEYEVDEDFTMVYDDDIDKIIVNNKKLSTYSCCKFFMYIASFLYTSETNAKFCYTTQKKVLSDIKINKESKMQYQKFLEEIKLLKSVVIGMDKSNKTCRMHNTYHCKYEADSIKQLRQEVERLISEDKLILLDRDKRTLMNKKRSITQKINHLKKKETRTKEENIELSELLKMKEEINK